MDNPKLNLTCEMYTSDLVSNWTFKKTKLSLYFYSYFVVLTLNFLKLIVYCFCLKLNIPLLIGLKCSVKLHEYESTNIVLEERRDPPSMRLNMWSYRGIHKILESYRWTRIDKFLRQKCRIYKFSRHKCRIYTFSRQKCRIYKFSQQKLCFWTTWQKHSIRL